MGNQIEFVAVNETEVKARITGAADRIAAEIMAGLDTVNTQLQRHIRQDKLSGQVLKSHRGTLKNAVIQLKAERQGDQISSGVGLGKEAPYGLAHEFGAHIPERVPTSARALHWIGKGGEEVFAMRARAFDLPERSFMRSSFREFRDRIQEEMREAVRRGATEK